MTAVWLVAAGVFFRNSLLTGFDKIIGDGGDARLDIFLRENLHQFLRGRAEQLLRRRNPCVFVDPSRFWGWLS